MSKRTRWDEQTWLLCIMVFLLVTAIGGNDVSVEVTIVACTQFLISAIKGKMGE